MPRKRYRDLDDDEWEGFDDTPHVDLDAQRDATVNGAAPAHDEETLDTDEECDGKSNHDKSPDSLAFSEEEDDEGIPIFPEGLIPGGQLSTQELNYALNAHGKEHGYAVTLRNGKKDKTGGISRYCVYCVKYGEPAPSAGAGLRKTATKRTGCQFKATVALKPEGWMFIHHAKPEHCVHNHGPALDAAAYRRHRQITPEIKAKVKALSAYTALRAREILAIVKGEHAGCDLTIKDINNLRQSIRRQEMDGCMPSGAIIKAFDGAGVDYVVKWSPENPDQLAGIFFTFKTCKELWKRFPDCLSLDNTYKTNSLGFPLFVVTAQTNINSIANVAFGLIDNERREGFDFLAQALNELRIKVGARPPAVTVTDRDH